MLDTVALTLQNRFAVTGKHITVALSGGRDSMALTAALLKLKDSLGFTLSALHIHHGLRAASDGEEAFVRAWCADHDLPLTVRHLQLSSASEQAAREARYAVFAEYISPTDWIATAHHLDDCAETFVINLARGCGITGLCSIPYERDGIIRPMLDVTREQIDEFVARNGIPHVHDESNDDTAYLRNFVRHEIIAPLSAREDVAFTHNFAITLQNLREERAALDEMARPYLQETDTAVLRQLPRAILWRVLHTRCPALTRERFAAIERQLAKPNAKEQIEGNLFAVIENGKLSFTTPTNGISPMPLTDRMTVGGKIITLQEINSQFTHFDIDCDTIKSDLLLRSRQSGDIFTHPKRGRTKTLKQMFSEDHVTDRDNRIVITDGDGKVVYVEGYGADKAFAADSASRKAIRIIIKAQGE